MLSFCEMYKIKKTSFKGMSHEKNYNELGIE